MIKKRRKFLALSSLMMIIGLSLAACQPFAAITDRLSEGMKSSSEKVSRYSFLPGNLVNLGMEKLPIGERLSSSSFSGLVNLPIEKLPRTNSLSLTEKLLSADSEYAYVRSDSLKGSETASAAAFLPGSLVNIHSDILPEIVEVYTPSSGGEISGTKVLANLMSEPRILIGHQRLTGKLVNLNSSIEPEAFVLGLESSVDPLTVQQVTSPGPGWVVVHADDYGSPGIILGYVSVKEGVSFDVVVESQSAQYAEPIYAMLHVDRGIIGEFEYPQGPDSPIYAESSSMIGGPVMVMIR